jgi:hypothetical protein
MHPLPSIYEMTLHRCTQAYDLYTCLKTDNRTKIYNMLAMSNFIYVYFRDYYIMIEFPIRYLDYYNLNTPRYCLITIFCNKPNYYVDFTNINYNTNQKRIDYDNHEEIIKEIELISYSGNQIKKYLTIKEVCPDFYKY